MADFIPQKGYYKNLVVYRVAEIIYDVTFIFAKRFLDRSDRTVDQMIQAARSGKQNIAEGSAAGSTSKETEIKLTNVAKASLQELLVDYEDYLRVRDLKQWPKDSEKAIRTRNICRNNRNGAFYREAVKVRSDETVANICIILIHQADVMLTHLIERQKADFLRNGGIREQMSAARRQYRLRSESRLRSENSDLRLRSENSENSDLRRTIQPNSSPQASSQEHPDGPQAGGLRTPGSPSAPIPTGGLSSPSAQSTPSAPTSPQKEKI